MKHFKDIEYINLILNGDTHAFEQLVDNYKDIVFTLALRMLKNREEAEELCQDTFMKVFKSLSKFKQQSKFSTWLYRITYNACLDKLKGRKGDHQTSELTDFNNHHLVELNNGLNQLEQREKKEIVRECLHLLDGEDSYLLTLYYFEEQSVDEISKMMDWSASNVKVKLFRSRKKLAAILRMKMEPEEIESYE